MRVKSLSLLKSKIGGEGPPQRERSMSPNEIAARARQNQARNKKEQIDTWIAR
jgi:hypothetical protein